MRSIIYRAQDESIEGYGVRLEEDDPGELESTLGAVLAYYYAGESSECDVPDRIDAISGALKDAKDTDEGLRYFDLTIDEAKIAADSLERDAFKALEGARADRQKRAMAERIQYLAMRIRSCTLIKTIVETGLLADARTAPEYKGGGFFVEVIKDPSSGDIEATSV